MRIAVAIPVYNDEIFVERSVNNCLEMEYDHVVYLDDGSTDNSYDKLMSLTREHSHIKVVRNKDNSVMNNIGNRWEMVAEECRKFNPDWIMTRATDEILSYPAKDSLKHNISELEKSGVNMIVFNYIHLWRSEWWYRYDTFWRGHHSLCLWKNNTGWSFNYGSGIHLGGHRPNKLAVKDIVHNINLNEQDKSIVVIHYGMSSHELLARKLDYQINTSLKIGNRAVGMYHGIPHPLHWQHINGYKVAAETNVLFKKVEPFWFNCAIPDVPQPKIESLYEVVAKYNKQRAEEYAQIYGR